MALSTSEDMDTTRTRISKLREEMASQNQEVIRQVKLVADRIDQRDRRQGQSVRLWVWVKKVLSFAKSEADKIRLDE